MLKSFSRIRKLMLLVATRSGMDVINELSSGYLDSAQVGPSTVRMQQRVEKENDTKKTKNIRSKVDGTNVRL